jgi:hypothetical protein
MKMKLKLDLELDDKLYLRSHLVRNVLPYFKEEIKRTQELDNYFCTSPALAFKYLKVFLEKGDKASPEIEKVLSKNTHYLFAYLKHTGNHKVQDPKLQKRFEKKVYSDPYLSYWYAYYVLKSRLPEEHEVVFLKNYDFAYRYACEVIGGEFPDNIHKMLVLSSFEEKEDKHGLKSYIECCEKKEFKYITKNWYDRNPF